MKRDLAENLGEFYSTVITDEEQEILRKSAQTFPVFETSIPDKDDLFTQVATKRTIPHRLGALLNNFRRNSNSYGMLLIRNLPLDSSLPTTPGKEKTLLSQTAISSYTLLSLMMSLGEPIAYEDEKEGAIIQNIVPVQGEEVRQENTGSVYLEFHTEDGFHPYKPDYIGLYCLRADHNCVAATSTASIRKALKNVPGKFLPILRQPLYRIKLSSSFLRMDASSASTAVPCSFPLAVLSGDTVEPTLCIDFHAMEALTQVAQSALEALKDALKQVIVSHVLAPGDLIIIDNRVAAHARTAFEARYDGADRWLQRLFVVEDFRRSKPGRPRGSHVCAPLGAWYFQEQGI